MTPSGRIRKKETSKRQLVDALLEVYNEEPAAEKRNESNEKTLNVTIRKIVKQVKDKKDKPIKTRKLLS